MKEVLPIATGFFSCSLYSLWLLDPLSPEVTPLSFLPRYYQAFSNSIVEHCPDPTSSFSVPLTLNE